MRFLSFYLILGYFDNTFNNCPFVNTYIWSEQNGQNKKRKEITNKEVF